MDNIVIKCSINDPFQTTVRYCSLCMYLIDLRIISNYFKKITCGSKIWIDYEFIKNKRSLHLGDFERATSTITFLNNNYKKNKILF